MASNIKLGNEIMIITHKHTYKFKRIFGFKKKVVRNEKSWIKKPYDILNS